MDGLIHAALEAEDILNRAKHVSSSLSSFGGTVEDHKISWSNDKLHLPEPVDECKTKCSQNSGGSYIIKTEAKFDLFKKLHEIFNELGRDELQQGNYQGLKTTSYLLEKLLATYNLNKLIINLYPGNKGYSLSLNVNENEQQLHPPDQNMSSTSDETLVETPRWPYEEEELLSYIDNEELPLVLMDLLESEHSNLFYSGCIIAQIRDYRQAYPNFLCDTHHVLLKPTNQSIITDAMCIGVRCGWATEDRAAIEAALVLATAPPLCLDPRPAVGLLSAKLHSAPRLFNTPQIRRQARRFSQVAVNRKRKLDQFTHNHGLELLDLIHRQRAKHRHSVPQTRLTSKYPKKPPETFKPIEPPRMEPLPLAVPSEPSAPSKLARAYERPRPSSDCQPLLVEEYVLETEKSSPHPGAGFFHIKLSILQRPSDQEFLGELYVDRDHVEGEKNGAACRFTLGTRIQANKYIQQFTEIFTEEGRKSVRIKHIVPGQLPRVSFTGGIRDLGQQLLLQQRNAAVAAAAAAASNTTVLTSHSATPIVTTTIGGTPNIHTSVRSLPILQAQLQCAGVSSAPSAPPGSIPTPEGIKQLPSPSTPRLSPQVAEALSSPASSNQLLAQQLTNPPQPLNPKMSPAIIHVQHSMPHAVPQVQNIQYTNTTTTQQKVTVQAKPRTTNAAISALVNSLMNSAQQFQKAASQKAAVSTTNSNPTIVNLLNSAPAAMSHTEDKRSANTTTRLIANAHHTQYTQVMSGYRNEGETSSVNNIENSTLLERLISPPNDNSSSATTTVTQPQTMCHVQGLHLGNLQSLSGVQNVQVQIPGLSSPISLSLNVSAPSGLLVSVPPTTSRGVAQLSLPIAQLMSSGVKGAVRGTAVQLLRGRAPRPQHNTIHTPTENTQFVTQNQPLNSQVRRKSNQSDGS